MYMCNHSTDTLLHWEKSNMLQREIVTIMRKRTSDKTDYNFIGVVEKIKMDPKKG